MVKRWMNLCNHFQSIFFLERRDLVATMLGDNLFWFTDDPKFYFLLTNMEIQSAFSLEDPVGGAFPCIDTKEGIRKKEHVSIGDLSKLITNSDEQVTIMVLKICRCS